MLLWSGHTLRDLEMVVIHPVGKHSKWGAGWDAGPLTEAGRGDRDQGQDANEAVQKVFATIRIFLGCRVEDGAKHPNTILKTMFSLCPIAKKTKQNNHQIKWKI